MKSLIDMIRNGVEKNEKELNEELLSLKNIKKIIEKDKSFNFEIRMCFNFDAKLLDVKYEIKNATNEISVYFFVDHDAFIRERLDISISLLEYATAYFNNNKELKFNAGDFDGDNYVDIKDYIKSLFEKDEELQFSIFDEMLEEEL